MILVLDFYANWCNPCKKLDPHLEKFKEMYPSYEFQKIDIEKEEELVEKYKIQSLPTILIINNNSNEILSKIEGFNLPLIKQELFKYSLK